MQSRNSLLPLLRQLQPRLHPNAISQSPVQRLFSSRTASVRTPISTLKSQTRHLSSPLTFALFHRLLHSTPRFLDTTSSSPPTSTSTSAPSPTAPAQTSDSASFPLPQQSQPSYQLTFTCKPCTFRSTHSISQHGYHKGTVLVTCPDCKNRHVVSDHLKIFSDKRVTLEDIMRQKGELVSRGRLDAQGDVEFYPPDGQGEGEGSVEGR